PNVSDQWLWRHDPAGGYSVRSVYHMLTSREVPSVAATTNLIWHKQVPMKISVLTWRLFRNRGIGNIAQHLFLSCPVFAPLCYLVRSWIGIFSADPILLQDHFVQFIHSAGGLRARRSFLQLIWLCCIWVVWNERNNRVFK
ncbi:70 kDa peptidyl-prolyl isomerase, partial [Trifolium medium]|nr:70 kDa peptidyl-prolyl isomerase [Trifolium medium]